MRNLLTVLALAVGLFALLMAVELFLLTLPYDVLISGLLFVGCIAWAVLFVRTQRYG